MLTLVRGIGLIGQSEHHRAQIAVRFQRKRQRGALGDHLFHRRCPHAGACQATHAGTPVLADRAGGHQLGDLGSDLGGAADPQAGLGRLEQPQICQRRSAQVGRHGGHGHGQALAIVFHEEGSDVCLGAALGASCTH